MGDTLTSTIVLKPKILDACVLIDYLTVGRFVLQLATRQSGPLHIVDAVFGEIRQLIDNEAQLVELGLVFMRSHMDDIKKATHSSSGNLSFPDRICYLTAQRNNLICVSNDIQLREVCQNENIDVLWGLELMLELHSIGELPFHTAIQTATEISKINSFITKDILDRFSRRLRKGN